ncbi:hypothetical protein Tco_1354695 [Tanacetum coccineum]
MLDYGFNFMNTKIYIDNESTICIVKNPVYHSKTKHIAIRHHFIRDAYEKKLIQVLKIHTNDNVADLLTKAFDLTVPTSGLYTFESKKIAQDVRARIQGKNSLVKHFEDMRLCRPSKEYFQFWTSAKSKTINHVRHITAKVAGKSVSISEASIRTDLIFDDADGIDTLPNQAIFNAIQLMGYEGDLTDEGASSERLSDEQPSPSPAPTSEVPNESLPDSTSAQPISTASANESLSLSETTNSQEDDNEIPPLEDIHEDATEGIFTHSSYDDEGAVADFTNLETVVNQRMHKKNVSKQGRKIAKGESTVQRDPMFDVMPEDNIDHMEADIAQSEGRTKELVDEDKELDEDRLSTEDEVSTDFEKVSTDKPLVSTDGSKVSTDEQIEGADDQVEGTEENNEGNEEIFESTEEQREGTEEKIESTDEQRVGTEDQTKEEIDTQASQTSTLTPTSVIFGDDETIATLLINMSKAKATSKEKEKGVELKDVEEIDRPRPTSTRSLLTLKPLPKIDPKDKGKKKIEEDDESESEDDDIPQAVKKFKQLESDEVMARQIQEEWEAEEERNRIAEEEATNEALIKNFDDIKARIEADRILAEKLQEQEREQFTIEERAKFLHDTIAAQRKFLAQQRSEAIRNRPPTKNQLRNQMMTYLKHVGNFKHSELKSKKFEDIQAMYEKSIQSLTETENLGTKPQFDESKRLEEINLNVVIRSNGQKRYFSTLMTVLSIFDREDLNVVYQLVMDKHQDEMPEGFDRVLWGDLMVLFNPDDKDRVGLVKIQHSWKDCFKSVDKQIVFAKQLYGLIKAPCYDNEALASPKHKQILCVEGAHFINHTLIANPVHECFNNFNVDWTRSMEYSAALRNCCISRSYEILEQVEQLELLVEPCGILYDDMKCLVK